MRRGAIWTVAGGAAYTGKPRPAVVLQDDTFDANDSIVVCPLTTDPTPAPTFRILIQPTQTNGLRVPCSVMVDKLTAVPRVRLGRQIGTLEPDALVRVSRAVVLFLGLGGLARR